MGPRDSRAKANWITWAPSGPRDSRAKPSGSLGPPVAQGIQELKTQVFVAATSGNQITSGTDTVAEVIVVP